MNVKNIKPNEDYSTTQVAKILGVSRVTVNHYINAGDLIAFQYIPGGRHRILGFNLLSFIEGSKK